MDGDPRDPGVCASPLPGTVPLHATEVGAAALPSGVTATRAESWLSSGVFGLADQIRSRFALRVVV